MSRFESLLALPSKARIAFLTGALLLASSCGEVSNQSDAVRLKTHGLKQVTALDEYTYHVTCPDILGDIGANPDGSWIHVIDGEVKFEQLAQDSTFGALDSQTKAEEVICHVSG